MDDNLEEEFEKRRMKNFCGKSSPLQRMKREIQLSLAFILSFFSFLSIIFP